MPSKTDTGGIVELHRLETVTSEIWIMGTAPLIMHAWSEKALRMMPGNPDAEVADRMRKKGLREPIEEALACLYTFPDGRLGFPSTGFKAATVGSYDLFEKMTKTSLKRLIYIEGEMAGSNQLVPIFYKGDPQLRTDAPRLANGGTDLRYRYQLYPWWAKLTIKYIPTSISAASVVALVDAGGLGGVGDWRPSSPRSSTGTFGTYRVMNEEDKVEYGIEN